MDEVCAPAWFSIDQSKLMEGRFAPRELDRYGERLAWSLAVALAALAIFLFWRRGVWIGSLIVIFSVCIVAAILISYGNWMERRTEIQLMEQAVVYRNPLRELLVEWASVKAVYIYPRGDGWRVIVEGDRTVREKRFRKWSPFFFLGREVSGKTLGIVGLGRIGKAVARRARGFEMPVLYYNRRRIQETEEKALGAVYVDLKTVLARCDFLTLHVPLTEETFHLISKEELQMMKPTAFLINASRGPVVDEKALVQEIGRAHV